MFKNSVHTLQIIPLHIHCDTEAANGVWRSGNRFIYLSNLC